jgi:hypothetical protein
LEIEMNPTDEMIEAGRMVLVDATGHGYGPDLVRAVYDAMRGAEAPAIVPDELVTAAARATDLLHDAVLSHVDEGWKYAAGSAVKELRAALNLPRRTEAELLAQGAADERERLATKIEREEMKMEQNVSVSAVVKWLRSQGGE